MRQSGTKAIEALRVFFKARKHAPCMRYTRAADGDPMWVACGYPGCMYVVEIGMAA